MPGALKVKSFSDMKQSLIFFSFSGSSLLSVSVISYHLIVTLY